MNLNFITKGKDRKAIVSLSLKMKEKVVLTKEIIKLDLIKMIAMIVKKMIDGVRIIIAITKKKMEDTINMTGKEIGNLESEKTSLSILIPILECTIRMILNSMKLSLKRRTLLSNSRFTYFWILILILSQMTEENLFQKVVSQLEKSL